MTTKTTDYEVTYITDVYPENPKTVVVELDTAAVKAAFDSEFPTARFEGLLDQALADQHDVPIHGGVYDIKRWSKVDWSDDAAIGTAEVDTKSIITGMVLRAVVMSVISHFVLKWMHKHVYPKHPKILFPFHRRYQRMLAENNAAYIIPSIWGPFINPTYVPKEGS